MLSALHYLISIPKRLHFHLSIPIIKVSAQRWFIGQIAEMAIVRIELVVFFVMVNIGL
jgi:hypothetical protein